LNAAEFLVVAPKIAQAVIAATGDYYTWKLAKKVYGPDSYGAWATVLSRMDRIHNSAMANKVYSWH
jgi:hypothetical protein